MINTVICAFREVRSGLRNRVAPDGPAVPAAYAPDGARIHGTPEARDGKVCDRCRSAV
ncbi:hypothetical protein GCM10023405_09330 [Streptomonospora salina]